MPRTWRFIDGGGVGEAGEDGHCSMIPSQGASVAVGHIDVGQCKSQRRHQLRLLFPRSLNDSISSGWEVSHLWAVVCLAEFFVGFDKAVEGGHGLKILLAGRDTYAAAPQRLRLT